jgi:hypothetical protein
MGVRPVYRMRPIAYCPMFKPDRSSGRPCYSLIEHIAPQSFARKAELPRPLTALPEKNGPASAGPSKPQKRGAF